MKLTDECKALLEHLSRHGECMVNRLPKTLRNPDALLEACRHRLIDYDPAGCSSVSMRYDTDARTAFPCWDRILDGREYQAPHQSPYLTITDAGKRAIADPSPFQAKVIETLVKANEPLTAEVLLPRTALEVTGHNRERLSAMVKLGLIDNPGKGYRLPK